MTQAGTYSVSITLGTSGCISTGKIIIEYAAEITPTPATIVQCDPDQNGMTIFNLKNAEAKIKSTDSAIINVKYYSDATTDDLIINPTSFNSAETTVYAKCFNKYS